MVCSLFHWHVIPRRGEVREFGVEDADEVVEEPVRTEGRLFVEIGTFDIAAIGAPILDGTKLTIAMMFGK